MSEDLGSSGSHGRGRGRSTLRSPSTSFQVRHPAAAPSPSPSPEVKEGGCCPRLFHTLEGLVNKAKECISGHTEDIPSRASSRTANPPHFDAQEECQGPGPASDILATDSAQDIIVQEFLHLLNYGTKEDLEVVKVISETRSTAILDFRRQLSPDSEPFKDLNDVEGIHDLSKKKIIQILRAFTGQVLQDDPRLQNKFIELKAAVIRSLLYILNTYTEENMQRVKGIGASIATEVVTHRSESLDPEPFKSIEDVKLLRLKGWSERRMLKEYGDWLWRSTGRLFDR